MQAFWLRISAATLLTALTVSTCSARKKVESVPEINAGSCATALTLVAGAMFWVQQARRRR